MHPPVHRVPVEIIANCFLLVLRDRIPAMSLDEPPLLFFVVCRRWRDIALSTPRLWSRILVQADKITPNGLNTALSAFAAWLPRSEPVPVSCYIMQPEWQPQRETKLLAIIFENAPKFLELHFDLFHLASSLTRRCSPVCEVYRYSVIPATHTVMSVTRNFWTILPVLNHSQSNVSGLRPAGTSTCHSILHDSAL